MRLGQTRPIQRVGNDEITLSAVPTLLAATLPFALKPPLPQQLTSTQPVEQREKK